MLLCCTYLLYYLDSTHLRSNGLPEELDQPTSSSAAPDFAPLEPAGRVSSVVAAAGAGGGGTEQQQQQGVVGGGAGGGDVGALGGGTDRFSPQDLHKEDNKSKHSR